MDELLSGNLVDDSLQTRLWTGAVSVRFTKTDGSQRVMICTLRRDLIPEDRLPKGNTLKKSDKNTIPVFDLENNAWRSFRKDSVISHEIWHDEP